MLRRHPPRVLRYAQDDGETHGAFGPLRMKKEGRRSGRSDASSVGRTPGRDGARGLWNASPTGAAFARLLSGSRPVQQHGDSKVGSGSKHYCLMISFCRCSPWARSCFPSQHRAPILVRGQCRRESHPPQADARNPVPGRRGPQSDRLLAATGRAPSASSGGDHSGGGSGSFLI